MNTLAIIGAAATGVLFGWWLHGLVACAMLKIATKVLTSAVGKEKTAEAMKEWASKQG